MTGTRCSSLVTLVIIVVVLTFAGIANGENTTDNLADTVKLLREQVNALLDHRQEDYNQLEESLKRAIEKNTELFVLRNEVKQLRKELNDLRGGNGNEAKNERLRVRWLGSAVTELQTEVAEVLRTRNASEELAERSRMRSEFSLLRSDVAEVGRGIRNLGGRIARIEAALGTIRIDITAVKERFTLLSRSCADITSQVSAVQVEVKSLKCDFARDVENKGASGKSRILGKEEGNSAGIGADTSARGHTRRRLTRRHGYSSRYQGYRTRLEDRLQSLERKISVVSQKRASLEKRVAYEGPEYLSKRVKSLEKAQSEFARRISNVTWDMALFSESLESSKSHLFTVVRALEDSIERNRSETNREIARLGLTTARKAAELSLTREELGNLRRAVQALSVSASKLQERSDRQQESIDRINGTLRKLDIFEGKPDELHEHEELMERYQLSIFEGLPGNCEENEDGLTLLTAAADTEKGAGQRAPLLVSCHGGWIVIARRIDGTLDFDRTWNDYSLGFGSPVGEFWIGNEALHRLTRDNCTSLRIDLVDIYGKRWRAEYESFNVDSEETGYRLRISGYSGNATDSLSYQNGMSFSAKDRDMDLSTSDCAANYHGGWWFSHCQHVNLNGKYSLGLTWFRSDTNHWMPVISSEMSVRIKPNCPR